MKPETIKNTRYSASVGMSLAGAVIGTCLLLLQVLSGCSSTTDPGPGKDPPATIGFSPVGQGQTLKLSETMKFYATTSSNTELSVSWYQRGQVVGQDTMFTYVPTAVGRDTLEVSAFVGAVRDTYYWVVTVEEDVSVIPPEVTGVSAVAGPEPADVVVAWSRVSGATYPLVEYLVAMSYEGPISEGNWDQATILSRITPIPSQIRYSITFTESVDGMMPGEPAWFAVRVADDRQQLSTLTSSVSHDITWPWYLGGYVYDDSGLPLLGVIVNASEGGQSSNSDANGFFLFDKSFKNIDAIRVATNSPSWYDFVTQPVSVDLDTTLMDITLITRHGLDDICYGGDFLDYLRDITLTNEISGIPEESKLLKWEQYPISVHIPAGLNDAGVDLEDASLKAMEFWNTTMRDDAAALGITETDFFVRTTDEAAADIVFLFESRPQNYGKISLLLPDGLDDKLGSVIPEKIEIWINTDPALWNLSLVQGVALHEFGHALGILLHPDCSNSDYLMIVAGGVGSMDRPEPIHQDEIRAVRAIRNLPQGVQMSDFTQFKTEFK